MLRFLLIGVGGSGGNTVRYTARELERRLIATGWRDGLPDGWQFLHVDVRQKPDDLQADVPANIAGRIRHLGLAEFPHSYRHYDGKAAASAAVLPALARWRPNPNGKIPDPYLGAGQRRAVGRIVTIAETARLGLAVNAAITEMTTAPALAEMARLDAHLGISDPLVGAPAQVVVISSLGGGAGAGAFLDTIQTLKARAAAGANWLSTPLLVAYAADIFESVPPALREGVEANTLASLAELLSAYENTGPLDRGEQAVIHSGGGTLPLAGNLGPAYTLIVGRSNGRVTMQSTGDVYRSTAKALAAYVSNPDIQMQFGTYLAAGWVGPTTRWSFHTGANATSSFGYGNVSLGRGIFVSYARERLAAAALQRLREGHLEGVSSDQVVRPEAMIRAKAEADRPIYFAATGLWELGEDNNQVLDALRDGDVQTSALDKVRDAVLGMLDSRELSASEWEASFNVLFDKASDDYATKERQNRSARAKSFADAAHERVVTATVDEAAKRGLPVALELLSMLRAQASDAVTELRAAASAYRGERAGKSVADALSEARDVFAALGRKIRGNDPIFHNAATHRRNALLRRTEEELHDFAADLLEDLANNLLPQLAAALQGLSGRLEADLADPAIRDRCRQWSTEALGAHLLPAPNEVLLEPVDHMPAAFEEQLMAVTNTDTFGPALSDALREIISGQWVNRMTPGTTPEQKLVETVYPWAPKRPEARSARNPTAHTAEVSTSLGVERLLVQAEAWIRDRQGPLSNYIHETLRSWLGSKDRGAQRAREFAAAIDNALDASSPMVSINSDAMQRLHGTQSVGLSHVISAIPLASGHPARQHVEESLTRAGMTQGAIAQAFDASSSVGEIEVVSFLAVPVHPLVFDSLMTPIHRDWLIKRDLQNQRADFWLYRRTRPLTSFVPVSPDHQLTMVRGWMTARLLEQIALPAAPTSAVQIWTPRGPRSFPLVLLTAAPGPDDTLPALFEAFPLALLSYAAGDGSEVEAYERLVQLGSGPTGQVSAGYPVLNGELAAWITTGVASKGEPSFADAPLPTEPEADTSGSTVGVRTIHAQNCLEDVANTYRQLDAQQTTQETSLSADGRWELRNLYLQAAAGISKAISALEPANGPRRRGIG